MKKNYPLGFTAEASAYITSNTYHGVYSASFPLQQIESAACTCTSWTCNNWYCPPPECGRGEKCCEPNPDGGCDLCWPIRAECP